MSVPLVYLHCDPSSTHFVNNIRIIPRLLLVFFFFLFFMSFGMSPLEELMHHKPWSGQSYIGFTDKSRRTPFSYPFEGMVVLNFPVGVRLLEVIKIASKFSLNQP